MGCLDPEGGLGWRLDASRVFLWMGDGAWVMDMTLILTARFLCFVPELGLFIFYFYFTKSLRDLLGNRHGGPHRSESRCA